MMSLTFGLFIQVSGSGPLGPLVSEVRATGSISILFDSNLLPAQKKKNNNNKRKLTTRELCIPDLDLNQHCLLRNVCAQFITRDGVK